ncbi:hypothetical protein CEXT_789901 [Caerostris extrusa]|uniref:Uncharacterized protein n=1 Tax=Caerostris extrusa TaxID=172846 RepID=A0AAV4SN69_CAEEX|nr:hypothetical protein CEXT_789901 [Caerostris extrusa]
MHFAADPEMVIYTITHKTTLDYFAIYILPNLRDSISCAATETRGGGPRRRGEGRRRENSTRLLRQPPSHHLNPFKESHRLSRDGNNRLNPLTTLLLEKVKHTTVAQKERDETKRWGKKPKGVGLGRGVPAGFGGYLPVFMAFLCRD